MFQSFFIVALMAATAALLLLGPAHSGQMDVYANPAIAQAGDSQTASQPVSPGIEGDHPGSLTTGSGPSASSAEGSGTARADTTGDARRDKPGSARRDTAGDARRDTTGDARRDTPGDAKR